jgi:hypothetical protein
VERDERIDVTKLADVEVQLLAAAEAIDPSFAARIPTGWDTSLIDLRADARLPDALRAAERLAAAWWYLLAATVASFGGWFLAARDRMWALRWIGGAVGAAGLAIVVVRRAAAAAVAGLVEAPSSRAAIRTAFDISTEHVHHVAIALLLASAVILAATTTGTTIPAAVRRLVTPMRAAAGRSWGPAAKVVWALVAVATGAALIVTSSTIGPGIAIAAGIALAFAGTRGIAMALPSTSAEARARTRWRFAAGTAVAVLLAVPTVLVVDSLRGRSEAEAELRCNGHRDLCDRRVDEVVFAGTHNSMASAEAGFLFGEQSGTIETQLQAGVRALLVDAHFGVPTDAGFVWTQLESGGRAQIAGSLGEEALALIERLRASTVPPGASPGVYLCHAFCELGATPAAEAFSAIRRFHARNPSEVVILIVQDEIPAAATVRALQEATLDHLAYVHDPAAPWPTLGELVRAGTPLIVMAERDGGEPSWFHRAFELVQDNPYLARTVDEMSCRPGRGPSDAPIFLLNHWITTRPPDAANARLVNDRRFIVERAQRCAGERGRQPNVIAVNFWQVGDLLGAVDDLNGVSRG